MYTSLVLFALSGFSSPAEMTSSPSWLMDYSLARQQGIDDKKPLAVFVGSGKEGWDKLVRNGALAKEQNKLLATSYVCVYLDTATADGKRLAGLFNLENGPGLIISDHSGKLMAFHHAGDLPAPDLTKYLSRYADPERVVRTTETNPNSEVRSYYAAPPAGSAPTTVRSC
jgi:hypothetical protein